MPTTAKVWIVLMLILLPALYIGLGSRPVYKIQEARIAETSREMVVSQDWIVPRYNGELRLQKPPLPYWLTALSYQAIGVNERAARIPSIIFTALTALLLFTWLRRVSSLAIAANATLMLATSYIAMRYARSGEADATLMFFIAAACCAGYRLITAQATRFTVLAFYGALGFGFLTKGPAGVAIPLLTVVLAAFVFKRAALLKQLWSLSGLLLFGLIALGWYAWIFWQMPEIAQHFFSKQVDETFISGTHARPVWWYLVHMFDFYLPWGLFIIPAGFWLYKHSKNSQQSTMPAAGLQLDIVKFALVWFAVVLVLLTFTVNKQIQYALLFAPPLAIVLAHYIHEATGAFAKLNRLLVYGLCLLVGVAIAYFLHKKVAFEWPQLGLLAMVLIPLAVKRILSLKLPINSVMLVASATASFYIFAELTLATDPEKTDAPLLMAQVNTLGEVYQAMPGDGAVSFYAGRVIPPLAREDIVTRLSQQQELLLIARDAPVIEGVGNTALISEGQLTLWSLKLRP